MRPNTDTVGGFDPINWGTQHVKLGRGANRAPYFDRGWAELERETYALNQFTNGCRMKTNWRRSPPIYRYGCNFVLFGLGPYESMIYSMMQSWRLGAGYA